MSKVSSSLFPWPTGSVEVQNPKKQKNSLLSALKVKHFLCRVRNGTRIS
jgi:hypothetical protein